MTGDPKKKVLIYLLLTFALSSIFYYLILARNQGKLSSLLVLGLMWCPGVAALATRLIYQGDLRGIGWGWGKTRYQAASYLLPLAGGLLVYGIAWLTGLGGFKGAVSQEVFDPLTVSRGKTEYWTTELGLGMTLFYGVVAYLCWRRRGELPLREGAATV